MGGCAGCAGPIRKQQLKNINRLDSPIREKVTSHQRPLYRQKDRVTLEQSQSPPLRLSGSINLLNVLTSSPSQAFPQPEPHQSTALRDIKNSVHKDQNRQNALKQSVRMRRTFSTEEHNISQFAQIRETSATSASSHASSEQILNGLRANNANLPTFSQHAYPMPLKKQDDLSIIRQLLQEESKTPQYVRQKRQQNGEDIIDDGGLERIEIEHMKAAGLQKYLKQLV